MPRFRREEPELELEEEGFGSDEQHDELIQRVAAYSPPMVPRSGSSLSVREQHLSGFRFPRALSRELMRGEG